MCNKFFSNHAIPLLGILLVQNAELLIPEAHTPEEIRTIRTLEAVLGIAERNTRRGELTVIHTVSTRRTLIDKFAILTPGIKIHAGLARE